VSLHPSDVLKSPAVYVAFQHLVGGPKMRTWALEALQAKPGERILDVGCGPAYYVEKGLPGVDYIGFDTDERYVEQARERLPNARIYCDHFGERYAKDLGPFDGVIMMGLLHHLEDEVADDLLRIMARSLTPRGRVIALDTTFFEGQSALSRFLAKNDRGDHVRTQRGFERLAERHFASIEGRIVGDTLSCPAASWLMVCRDPHAAADAPPRGDARA
jgi:SAM-dependent methyltransferase